MSWTIGLIDNDVVFSKECAEALMAVGGNDDLWYDIEELQIDDNEYQLSFSSDHREHMDYLHREDILDVLLKFKVNGDVTFASVEGDNAGQSWGYRFKNGVLTELVGEIVYKEA